MKIPAEIIYRRLEGQYEMKRSICDPNRMIRGVFFARQDPPDGEYIYILKDGIQPEAFRGRRGAVLFLLSDREPELPVPGCDLILFPVDTDRERLLNDTAGILQEYYDWAEQIGNCSDSYAGIREMMDLANRKLNASMILTDAKHQFLYYTEDFIQRGYLDSSNRHLPSEATLRMLAEDEDYFPRLLSRKDVYRFPEKDYHEASLCYNLFAVTGATQGTLMLLRPDGAYTPDDSFILEYLGYRIARILRSHVITSFPLDSYRNFRQALAQLLESPDASVPLLEGMADRIGWKKEDSYFMLSFHPVRSGEMIIAKERLRSQMERNYPGAFSVEKGNAVYLVMNAKRKDIEMSFPELRRICEPYHVIISAGPEMDEISQAGCCGVICDAFAEISLEAYADSIPDPEELLERYLLGFSTRSLPKKLLLHPAVRELQKYDSAHGTPYLETLDAYLKEDRSPTRASRRLYIHRSTFLERLDRIKSIMEPWDLDNWRTRFLAALSLELAGS